MAKNEKHSYKDIDEDCIFCLITNDRDQETAIIKRSKDLVCFRDICPAAPHHYLVVPKEHIHSCCSLNRKHISLVKQMVELGKAALGEEGITDMEDVRFGFHKPPFISVGHLHLHVLAPSSKLSKSFEYKFMPGTDSFVTAECLMKHLQKVTLPGLPTMGNCLRRLKQQLPK